MWLLLYRSPFASELSSCRSPNLPRSLQTAQPPSQQPGKRHRLRLLQLSRSLRSRPLLPPIVRLSIVLLAIADLYRTQAYL